MDLVDYGPWGVLLVRVILTQCVDERVMQVAYLLLNVLPQCGRIIVLTSPSSFFPPVNYTLSLIILSRALIYLCTSVSNLFFLLASSSFRIKVLQAIRLKYSYHPIYNETFKIISICIRCYWSAHRISWPKWSFI